MEELEGGELEKQDGEIDELRGGEIEIVGDGDVQKVENDENKWQIRNHRRIPSRFDVSHVKIGRKLT